MALKKNAKDKAISVVRDHKRAFTNVITLQDFLNANTSLCQPPGNEFRLIVKQVSPFRTEIEITSSKGNESYKAYVCGPDVFPKDAIDKLTNFLAKTIAIKKPDV